MSSEWMKVMLEEIARKKDEVEQASAEAKLRSVSQPAPTEPAAASAAAPNAATLRAART